MNLIEILFCSFFCLDDVIFSRITHKRTKYLECFDSSKTCSKNTVLLLIAIKLFLGVLSSYLAIIFEHVLCPQIQTVYKSMLKMLYRIKYGRKTVPITLPLNHIIIISLLLLLLLLRSK